MPKPLSELIRKVSKNVESAASTRAAEMLAEMNLEEIRKIRHMTQNRVAKTLHITQPSVAQLEKRNDVYISTLRNYLSSIGAKLELVASFPDDTKISIAGFNSLNSSKIG